jgi:hypothetical protein
MGIEKFVILHWFQSGQFIYENVTSSYQKLDL